MHAEFAVLGFEPRLPDSKSGVLTTTLYRKKMTLLFSPILRNEYRTDDKDGRLD